MKKNLDKIGFSATIVVCFTFVYLFFEIIYKTLHGYTFEELGWQYVLILSMALLFIFFSKDEIAYNVPRSLFGGILPLSINMKKERRKQYLYESMMIGFIISFINIFLYFSLEGYKYVTIINFTNNYPVYDMILNTLILFLLTVLILYPILSYICERNVRLYTGFVKNINKK